MTHRWTENDQMLFSRWTSSQAHRVRRERGMMRLCWGLALWGCAGWSYIIWHVCRWAIGKVFGG